MKKTIFATLLLIVSLFVLAACENQHQSQIKESNYSQDISFKQFDYEKTKNEMPCLLDIFIYFDEKMSSEDKETVKNTKFDDLIQFHMGWGTGIRNAWLWGGDSDIYNELAAKGFDHPDNMSMFIIGAYHLYLNGLD